MPGLGPTDGVQLDGEPFLADDPAIAATRRVGQMAGFFLSSIVARCYTSGRMRDKELLAALIRFFTGFCVNVAAAYFLGAFVANMPSTLTESLFLFILSSEIAANIQAASYVT